VNISSDLIPEELAKQAVLEGWDAKARTFAANPFEKRAAKGALPQD